MRNVKKTLNTFTLSSSHNTSVLEKPAELLTLHPMTFIHQTNIATSYAHKTGTAQSRQITTLEKLPTHSEL